MKNILDTASFKQFTNSDPSDLKLNYLLPVFEDQEVHLKINEEPVKMSNRKLSTIIFKEQNETILKQMGVDTSAQMESVLKNDFKQGVIKDLINEYSSLGKKSFSEMKNKTQRIISRFFPNYVFYKYNGGTERDKIAGIINLISLGSNMIGHRSRMGKGDFLICNSQVASYIQDGEFFVPDMSGGLQIAMDLYKYIGNIHSSIDVFVDPFARFDDNYIIIGKRTSNNQSGVYLGIKEGSIENKETEDQIIKDYNNSFFIKSTQDSHKNFIRFDVKFEKRPFWKKLLSI